jgi:hypothetical protein
MSATSTFYLDAPSFSSATVIYSDADLTIIAPDGFYSDGFVVREQVSGVLLPQVVCESCSFPCGETINVSVEQGVYYLNTNLGEDTGAVIITFEPYGVPDGILATFDSQTYNGVSSPNYGWLQGSAGLVTYIGATASDCGIVSGSPYTLSEYRYDGVYFAPLSTTTSVSIGSGQSQLTAGVPGNTVMVIPKTSATPSVLALEFIGPCPGTAFDIQVSCPAPLISFEASTSHSSFVLACQDAIDQTYYVAHVNGSGGELGLYDLVFSDPNGEFKLDAGFYKTNDAGENEWFQVDENGVIIDINVCVQIIVPCGGTITASGEQGIYYLSTELGEDTGAVIVKFNPFGFPDGILAYFNSQNYNGLSSPSFGWLQGTAELPTYLGTTVEDCGIVAGSPYNLNEYIYDGSTFAPLGTTASVTITSGQSQLTLGEPGNNVMVIPKTTASPSVLDLQFIGPCPGTVFDIQVSCPAALTSFEASISEESSSLACEQDIDQTYYVAHVNGAAGVLGLYDLVFSDPNGEFKLGVGFYSTDDAGANEWFEVDANGVIIAFGTCVPPEIEVTNAYGYMEPCFGGTVDDYMGAYVSVSSPVAVDTDFQVEVQYTSPGGSCIGASTQTFTITILEGQTTSTFDACSSGLYVPGGADICNACISYCSDSAINLSTFGC